MLDGVTVEGARDAGTYCSLRLAHAVKHLRGPFHIPSTVGGTRRREAVDDRAALMIGRPRESTVQRRLGENEDVSRVKRGLLYVLR